MASTWAHEVDVEQPNIARVYDYLLRGGHNFEQDRELARKGLDLLPNLTDAAMFNRAFLFRAVRFCLEQGIRQFLDLGSGIPTVGNVHEVAHALQPEARVVYVDHEPVAVAHGEQLLREIPNANTILADICEPDSVFVHPSVRELLDFDEPIAVLMVAVLHSVSDEDDPARLVGRYREAMAPGSYLVLSHGTPDQGSERLRNYIKLYADTPNPVYQRSHERVSALLDGFEPVAPGLVWTPEWRPEDATDVPADPERGFCYAAVSKVKTGREAAEPSSVR